MSVVSFITIGIFLTLISLLWIDEPKKILYSHHPEMYRWIKEHTQRTDVFAVPLSDSELFIAIPIVAQRAVYYANAMAFADQYLEENTIRKNFLFGSYTEWREGGPGSFYCNLLDDKRLKQAAKKYPLHWVIMPNKCLNDQRFSELPIVFRDDRLSILKV